MEGKKAAVIVALIVVIAVAAFMIARRSGLTGGGPQPPEWYLKQPMTLIDMKPPYAIMTKTRGEWTSLGTDDAGHYKNPDTKTFTMAEPITCKRCLKQIPPPLYPPMPAISKAEDRNKYEDEKHKIDSEYKCPLCGQSPFKQGELGDMSPAGRAETGQ